jgi:transcriptional regulator with XRE-family HTH domain
MMNDDLGERLRAARRAKGLSLRAVAASVGISPSLLSQVENGKTHPSVSTLYALVSHLDVSIDVLLGNSPSIPIPVPSPESRPESVPGITAKVGAIQRREDSPTIEMENGVTWERMAVGGYGVVDPLITTYKPGGSSSIEGRLMRHAGIEYGYLIEGELTLKLDFDTFLLRAGDSLCFDSQRPHIYINHTDKMARGLWFVLGRSPVAEGQADPLAEHGLQSAGERPLRSAVDVLEVMSKLRGPVIPQ